MLPNPTYLILLYSCLQMHPTFLSVIHQTNHIRDILLKSLQGLYHSVDKSQLEGTLKLVQLPYIYTSLTCIELLLQEVAMVQCLFHQQIPIQQLSWFKDKLQVNHKVPQILQLLLLFFSLCFAS